MKNTNDNVHPISDKRERDEMQKEAVKELIRQITLERGISPSQLARESGVAESTITGFMNDRSGRAKHGLSAQTQNAIAQKFPEFKQAFSIPKSANNLHSIPVIGQWKKNYNVTPLMPNMAQSISQNYFNGIENQSAIMETKEMLITHVRGDEDKNDAQQFSSEEGIYRTDTKYYVFNNEFENPYDASECLGKTCYGVCEDGIFYLGVLSVKKGKARLLKFNGERIRENCVITGVSKILWCAFL